MKDYHAELGRFDIHMKDGREKFLNEVATWWESMYPRKADWFRENLRRMREVSKNADGSYHDAKNRTYYVKMRVPTELLLFIQRWVPDFGQDSKDMDLLVRVFCDLVRVGRDRRKRTTIYNSGGFHN